MWRIAICVISWLCIMSYWLHRQQLFTANFLWIILSMIICRLISGYSVCSVRLIRSLQLMLTDTHEKIMYDASYLHTLQTKLHNAEEIDMCWYFGCCFGLQDQSSETVGLVNRRSMPLFSAPYVFSQSQASPSAFGKPLGINWQLYHILHRRDGCWDSQKGGV